MYKVLLLALVACVRAPSPIDLDELVAAHGPVQARQSLELRVLDEPRDVQARLALAALADRTGRPGEALEQLAAVEQLGGVLGTRWHDDDRTRYARLLAARGDFRLANFASGSLSDLEKARMLGASVSNEKLEQARFLRALQQLRHVDADVRAKGRAYLATLAHDNPWRLDVHSTPADHGRVGSFLLAAGARREAYEQLASWHAATTPPRDEQLQSSYLYALAWWLPLDAPPPPAEDLVGPASCWFKPTGCDSAEPASEHPAHPVDAGVDPFLEAAARYAFGYHDPWVKAGADREPKLYAIGQAFLRDPVIAERLGRERVAASIDGARAHAELGALFLALGDPGRSRIEWQAAVDASPEPAYVEGLAEAAARGGDGPAALVFATRAAAAMGNPAEVWGSIANALEETGRHVDAMQAVRSGLELAGRDTAPLLLDLAIQISRSLGRDAQAESLTTQRKMLPPDPEDVREALDAYQQRPNASSLARLWVVARAHTHDVPLLAAIYRGTAADDPRHATIARYLITIATFSAGNRALDAVRALSPR